MILEVHDLVKTFGSRGNRQTAVDHISFSLAEKECLGIIGESGSGKSTTANLIAGFLAPDSGTILYEGRELTGIRKSEQIKRRKNMQMVFQDPVESFDPKKKLGASIVEPLICAGKRQGLKEELDRVLALVELKPEYAEKYPWQVSGGECQRAAIARALIPQPSLLICDEVTSALDVSVQAQIIGLLYRLKKDLGMSMVFISHDLSTVSSLCDHVAVMYKGKYLEYGETGQVTMTPGHPYTEDLLENAMHPGRKPLFEDQSREGKSRCVYASYCRRWDAACETWEEQTPTAGERFVLCEHAR